MNARVCRHCGGGPTARHAVRTVDVPLPASPAWAWLKAEIVRMRCPSCLRTTETGLDRAEASLGAARMDLVRVLDAHGPSEATRRSGLDVRTAIKWIDRALDDGLDGPLPQGLRLTSAGPDGPVVLIDPATGTPIDAVALDPDAIAKCLRRHGGSPTEVWISLDIRIRDAVESTFPAADLRADPGEGCVRLAVIANGLHASGKVPEAALILGEAARVGWRPPTVGILRGLCLRHGAKRASTFLVLWGDMIEAGLLGERPSGGQVTGFAEWSPRRFRAALLARGLEIPLVPDAQSRSD